MPTYINLRRTPFTTFHNISFSHQPLTIITRAALCLALCLALAVSPAWAQGADMTEEGVALQDGAWALQFRVAPNFTLDSFQGSLLSVKKQISDRSALRLGLGLNVDVTDEDLEDGEDADRIERSRADNQYVLDAEVQYLRYIPTRQTLLLFYGFGPEGSYGRFHDESTLEDLEFLQRRTLESTAVNYSVGLGGVVGAEWFVLPYISFSGEYSLSARYSRRKTTNRQIDVIRDSRTEAEDSRTLTSYRVLGNGVRFGLSVYF